MWNYALKPYKVTTGTLIYWLNCDNSVAYKELFHKKKLNSYKTTLNLGNEKDFNDQRMHHLLTEDIKILGMNDYIEIMEETNSFRYFNKFHLHCTTINVFYKINLDGNKTYLTMLSDINSSYCHYKLDKKYFILLWKESNQRNRVEKIDFLPKLDYPINTYNTFSGFVYETDENNYNLNLFQIKFGIGLK